MPRQPAAIAPRRRPLRAALLALLTTLALTTVAAAELAPFTSDGCSLFPDGTLAQRNQWCDCCLEHDLAYWQGGTAGEREEADTALRACVLEKTGDANLAAAMYLGVRAGGHPAGLTWYRWGYGWPYGRGYQPLSLEDRAQVTKALAAYWQQNPRGYCGNGRTTPLEQVLPDKDKS